MRKLTLIISAIAVMTGLLISCSPKKQEDAVQNEKAAGP